MSPWSLVAVLLLGLAIGALATAWFLGRGHRLALDAARSSADAEAGARVATAEARLAARDDEVRGLQARLVAATADARTANDALADARVARAGLEAELRDERERAGEKLGLLVEARDELSAHFRLLAGEALENNRKRMAEQHHGALEQILKPLGEKIFAFEKKVEDTYDKETQQRTLLHREVTNLQQATARINEDAINLTRALKGEAKTRGNWGEVVLERVLERSGLVRGVEYQVQLSLRGDDGSVLRPDVVVRLPDNKHIVIDSKVSLVAYDRYHAAVDDDARHAAGRLHVDAVRRHARDLGQKGYHARDEVDSPNFVAMFVPIEPALGLASSLDESLFVDAWERNVVIVTPSTLLAVLSTVQTLWQREKQNRNAIEIAKKAGRLYDQFALVIESLDCVGTHLERATRAFDDTRKRLADGKGNVVGRVEQLRAMGAKARKRLPGDWIDRAGAQAVDDDPADDAADDVVDDTAEVSPVQSTLTLVTAQAGDGEPR